MASEAPFLKLHGASVLVNLIPQAWRVFRQSWFLLIPLFFGGRAAQGAWIDFAILLFVFLRTVGATVVQWLTLRYRVIDGRLEIETGLLQRQIRSIDADRVQNVERVQNIFQRAAGLVEGVFHAHHGGAVDVGRRPLQPRIDRVALVEGADLRVRGDDLRIVRALPPLWFRVQP